MIDVAFAHQEAEHHFGFFTNHALALITIAKDPRIRMREIAETIGITERAVQRIVDDLTTAGYISVVKDGRRNCYEICRDSKLGNPLKSDVRIGGLLEVLVPQIAPAAAIEMG